MVFTYKIKVKDNVWGEYKRPSNASCKLKERNTGIAEEAWETRPGISSQKHMR